MPPSTRGFCQFKYEIDFDPRWSMLRNQRSFRFAHASAGRHDVVVPARVATRGYSVSSSIAAAMAWGAAWCGICPTPLRKTSFALGTVAASAQAFISGETMVSRSPVIIMVGERRSA